jgi:hypothetical protein
MPVVNRLVPTRRACRTATSISTRRRRAREWSSIFSVWMPDDNRYIRDLALGIGDDKVPYQPWARRLFDERKDGLHSGEDPDAHCLPQGVPKLGYVSYPWKLIETPSGFAILYETFTFWRQIFTDGRTVDPTAKPAWMGYSTGRWDGDTLVVTTTGFRRQELARSARAADDGQVDRHGAIHAHALRAHAHRRDGRRSRRVHGAVVGFADRSPSSRMGTARVHLQREQQGHRESAGQRRGSGADERRGGAYEGVPRVSSVFALYL